MSAWVTSHSRLKGRAANTSSDSNLFGSSQSTTARELDDTQVLIRRVEADSLANKNRLQMASFTSVLLAGAGALATCARQAGAALPEEDRVTRMPGYNGELPSAVRGCFFLPIAGFALPRSL